MSEQRCGTCRWYEPAYGQTCLNCGYCLWAEQNLIPWSMEDREWPVTPLNGRWCKQWLAKETQDAA